MQAECIQHGLRTIAFCHTRKMCELVTAYTRETLKSSAPHLTSSISVYRAGYSPEVGAKQMPSSNPSDSLLSVFGNARVPDEVSVYRSAAWLCAGRIMSALDPLAT